MNQNSLNSVVINGFRNPLTTVRVMVVAYAAAFTSSSERVWRRSVETLNTGVAAADGRLWITGALSASASASTAVMVTIYRHIRDAFLLALPAVTEVFAQAKPRTEVKLEANALGLAQAVISSRALRRAEINEMPEAAALVAGKVRVRSPEVVPATAFADIGFTVYRQLPWDEPAPFGRRFLVPSETNYFKVP